MVLSSFKYLRANEGTETGPDYFSIQTPYTFVARVSLTVHFETPFAVCDELSHHLSTQHPGVVGWLSLANRPVPTFIKLRTRTSYGRQTCACAGQDVGSTRHQLQAADPHGGGGDP